MTGPVLSSGSVTFLEGWDLTGNGLLNHTYQSLGVDTYKQTSTNPIPTGDGAVKMLFDRQAHR